jgi:hypothetical protein
LTEFNLNRLEIDSQPSENRRAFVHRVCQDPRKFGVVASKIEPCRIYSFENHLHRAVDPQPWNFGIF